MQDYEKLGAFYLGRRVETGDGATPGDVLLYDSKDLTTHAVIVGMTGSGKTGLGISLLEEAAIDGIPAIVIDPKGDMADLLLAFPDLAPADFAPWVDPGEAARRGIPPAQLAAETAALWKSGLEKWGQDGDRVRRYRDSVDIAIYTPGSTAGIPMSVLKGFDAPPAALAGDADAMRERTLNAVSGLLALLGIEADPIRSREHMLLSNILAAAWREGRSLDLADLIRQVGAPPFDRIGVMDLETFYPSKDRASLAMALNGLLASPGFSVWMQGEPLDVKRLLWTEAGKPRLSIVSIAHLQDAERMFFLTTLFNEVVAWMRAQPGTESLRALLYMDEVFGYFPPTANPPSKPPMLTLMKQARAFGLGVVLATQNPVDLDYKGLSNAGTWFLGRLQTERDKARVIEGLEGASAAAGRTFDRAATEATIAGLGKRVFLMNDVHEQQPLLFQTRWALSYLRGPLTRVQIQSLMAARNAAAAAGAPPPPAAAPTRSVPAAGTGGARPLVPSGILERFCDPPPAPGPGPVEYRPTLLATARIHYVDRSHGVDTWEAIAAWGAVPADETVPAWKEAQVLEASAAPSLGQVPAEGAAYGPLPGAALRSRSYDGWAKDLKATLYRERPIALWRSEILEETSRPGESEGDFRVRVGQRLREKRDAEVDAVRRRYAPKVDALQERIRVAEQRVAREKSQASQAKLQTGISFGAAILGALLGRKRIGVGTVGRATTAARGLGRAERESQDVARATESVEALRQRLQDLNQDADAELQRLREQLDPTTMDLAHVRVAPRKSDLAVDPVTLVWVPSGVPNAPGAEHGA